MTTTVIAKPNGQGAVTSYNQSVSQLQKRIADKEAELVLHRSTLTKLLDNPVTLHSVTKKA